MKKITLLLSLLCIFLLCSACMEEPDPTYDVTVNGRIFAVDSVGRTIECDGQVISYTFSGGGSAGTKYEFTYPDGATYSWLDRDFTGNGGWSDDYDESIHIPGEDLIEVLSPSTPQNREKKGNPMLGFLLIAVGLFNAIAPQKAWYISYGWRYKDAEPSDVALGWARFTGIAGIVIGVILLFV